MAKHWNTIQDFADGNQYQIISNYKNLNTNKQTLKFMIMKTQKMYLIEDFGFMKGNVFCGSEKECQAEIEKKVAKGCNRSNYFISINRFD